MLDQDTIKGARQADLVQYLLSRNEPLIRNGHRYKHKDHDSLVFTKNAFYWNSRQEHGNAVDFLMTYYNMTFNDAVIALTSNEYTPTYESDPRPSASSIEDLKINKDCKRAIAYLNKTRYIDNSVIKSLIDTKHLYQEVDTNNILFPMYDSNNNYVGAEVQGSLSDKRFKGVKPNSKYGYGFNIRYSENNVYDYALFFESAIDLLSFIDLKTNHDRKTLKDCVLVSMGGLKINIVKHTLEVYKACNTQIKTIVCVDNDVAADNFLITLASNNIRYIDRRPEYPSKDYNEQLIALRRK